MFFQFFFLLSHSFTRILFLKCFFLFPVMQHVRNCGPQLFIISRKGGMLLAINDFIYRSNLKRFGPMGDKVYWECIHNRSKKCRSRLKTIGDDLYVTNGM